MSDRHLFADKDWDECDPDDTEAMIAAVREWLRSLDTELLSPGTCQRRGVRV